MGNKFAELAFTPSVHSVQRSMGSSKYYDAARNGATSNERLGADEQDFISQRDSFYMASVSETGWPYVQHRGGPAGFLKVISDTTLGFADYRGNRQYVSVGNVLKDDRVALILVDYPNRARLKVLGHARIIPAEDSKTLAQLQVPGYRARVERGFIIEVAAYDWNCPQHITPRFSEVEIGAMMSKIEERLSSLQDQLRECQAARLAVSEGVSQNPPT